MFYYLLYECLFANYPNLSFLNVFRYITFRTTCASLTALLIALILGPWLIRKLKEFQVGQHIREEGPPHHHHKSGTPTMGGILIVVSSVIPVLLWANLKNPFVWIAIFSIIGFGAIGFTDDYIKIKKRRNLGLTARYKMGLQLILSLFIAGGLLLLASQGRYETDLTVPFLKNLQPNLVLEIFSNSEFYFLDFLPFLIFLLLILVGSSNAVNLTDGLDGLAIGCVVVATGALTVLTYVTSHANFAYYLGVPHQPEVGELTIFCGALVGAALGFLWYNCYPAELFMGDVGSLALGGAIGTIAVVIKHEILLIAIAGVFVLEVLSVIVQVFSFKLRRKRIFLMAPLHHHFELLGWKESKVVVRFWIAALIFALFSLTTLKLR
ncbi:MAG: phospho-N-acetylmuramoyl-pentapeptide-transferase [Acidobacteriia bacterium]|jgi:phospho-N-acetylmuramoyl-pentapeptide-transferase|nr:phospho-N-acetylmuramoyl-pentapeptide-transferase [Terriglobia bacterium]